MHMAARIVSTSLRGMRHAFATWRSPPDDACSPVQITAQVVKRRAHSPCHESSTHPRMRGGIRLALSSAMKRLLQVVLVGCGSLIGCSSSNDTKWKCGDVMQHGPLPEAPNCVVSEQCNTPVDVGPVAGDNGGAADGMGVESFVVQLDCSAADTTCVCNVTVTSSPYGAGTEKTLATVPFQSTFCSADSQVALSAAASACGWKL